MEDKAKLEEIQAATELKLQQAKFFSALTEVANNLANLLGAFTAKIRAAKP